MTLIGNECVISIMNENIKLLENVFNNFFNNYYSGPVSINQNICWSTVAKGMCVCVCVICWSTLTEGVFVCMNPVSVAPALVGRLRQKGMCVCSLMCLSPMSIKQEELCWSTSTEGCVYSIYIYCL